MRRGKPHPACVAHVGGIERDADGNLMVPFRNCSRRWLTEPVFTFLLVEEGDAEFTEDEVQWEVAKMLEEHRTVGVEGW